MGFGVNTMMSAKLQRKRSKKESAIKCLSRNDWLPTNYATRHLFFHGIYTWDRSPFDPSELQPRVPNKESIVTARHGCHLGVFGV